MKPRFLMPALLLLAILPYTALAGAPVHACRILAEHPHWPESFTQGLFIHQGRLYESSGGYGESFLAEVELKTGRHIRTIPINRKYFAEGIATNGDTLRLLTWKSGTGFIHSLDTLEQLESFTYRSYISRSEGWGLTHDTTLFIRSSGEPTLSFHDSDDFTLVRTLPVRDGDRPVSMLNELEYVNGLVLANIWKKDRIAVIDPDNGNVRAWIDLTPLRKRLAASSGRANGIAYDTETDRLYVTGKHWNKLFEIEKDESWWQ